MRVDARSREKEAYRRREEKVSVEFKRQVVEELMSGN